MSTLLIDVLRAEIMQNNGVINDLQAEIDRLRAELDQVCKILADRENEITRLREEISNLNIAGMNTCVELDRLRAERDALLTACKAVIAEWREGYGLNCVEQVRAAIKASEGK